MAKPFKSDAMGGTSVITAVCHHVIESRRSLPAAEIIKKTLCQMQLYVSHEGYTIEHVSIACRHPCLLRPTQQGSCDSWAWSACTLLLKGRRELPQLILKKAISAVRQYEPAAVPSDEPTAHEQLLEAFPCLNPFSAAIVARAVPMTSLMRMVPADLPSLAPRALGVSDRSLQLLLEQLVAGQSTRMKPGGQAAALTFHTCDSVGSWSSKPST